jgi:hypothetical protein
MACLTPLLARFAALPLLDRKLKRAPTLQPHKG